MELIVVSFSFTISLLTGLVVFQKNKKSATNVYFSLLIFFISAYPFLNYFAVHAGNDQAALMWAKAILLVSIPQGPLLYFFSSIYPENGFIFNKKRQILIILWVLLNFVLATMGMIFKSVSVDDGKVGIQPGPLVPSFGLLHASSIIAGLAVLYKKYKRSLRTQRKQLSLIFYGILISFSLTFLITFILPVLLKSTILLAISPLFLTISVLVVAYAIVAQKLFDIRAAVARSVTYVLLICTMAGLYALVIYGGIDVLFSSDENSVLRQVLTIVAVVPLALSFQGIKNFFDKVTNKLFFKDAYDTQEVINQLGSVIVAEIDLKVILDNSRNIIRDALKSSFIEFVLFRKGEPHFESLTNKKLLVDFNELIEHIKNHRKDVLVTEAMSPNSTIRQELTDDNISVILRLKTHHQNVGFIFFGEKRSGDIFSKQDIQLLNIVANELAVAIQNALRFEEIQNFAITMQERVDDATTQLRKTNRKLKELDEAKDEFISMASHQLRTPLTSMKGYVSMVLEGDSGKINKLQKKLLDQAFVSSQRMVYLIADLLNVSRLKTGKFIIETKPTNLAQLVDEEISQLYETAKGRGIELSYTKPAKFPELMLDETKIRQVVMNFTDNAIYYTPSGGHINVIVEEKPESVEFRVEDDGLGVPKAEQHHLFTKFYRAGNAKKARPDGTGLGLFMAKKVIAVQGGVIIFNSVEGQGSTFGFSFAKANLKPPVNLK